MTTSPPANPFRARFGALEPGTMEAVDDDLRKTVPPGCLMDVLNVELTHAGPGAARAVMTLSSHHMNQVGVAQAGAIVTLADAVAGWAAKTALPDDRAAFSTLELKMSLLRVARAGEVLEAVARPVHLGRTTMVLAVDVHRLPAPGAEGEAKLVATFACTQLVTMPRSPEADE